MPRNPRKRTVKSVKASCDRLWSKAVRARVSGCARCARQGNTEAHHAYGRANHRLRYEVRNGVALCHACHRWAEHYPLAFTAWFELYRAGDAEFLEREFKKGTLKRTLDDYLQLEAELKDAV